VFLTVQREIFNAGGMGYGEQMYKLLFVPVEKDGIHFLQFTAVEE
jgi:hypothetical protein